MPRKDGTGPTGRGPMTGVGSGKCMISLNAPEEELNYLENREKVLRQQIKQVESRLSVLKTTAARSER